VQNALPTDVNCTLAAGPVVGSRAHTCRYRAPTSSGTLSTTRRLLTPEVLSETVAGLLRLEDQYRRDVEATTEAPAAAEAPHASEADYPGVIVIDDDCDEDIAV